MAIIQKVKLENYKSFHNLEFDLKPLNVLIGRSGSGKSNFISFFRLLKDAADERLVNSINTLGGINEILWRGGQTNAPLYWQLTFDELTHIDNRIHYCGEIARRGNSFSIQTEEISRDPNPGFKDGYKFLSASGGSVRFLTRKPSTESGKNLNEENIIDYRSGDDYNDQQLVIAQIRDPVTYPLPEELRRSIVDWINFRGFGETAIENIYGAQSLDIISPLRLDTEGRNLISVLYTLFNNQQYAPVEKELTNVLRQAFNDYRRLIFPLVASGKVELQWVDQQGFTFPARSLSDGMIRFLGLATLLLLPDPPSLITIDEPEIGLHPELIPLLVGLLKSASQRTQIIVATHSPLFLNELEPEDVVVVENRQGQTTFDRLDSGSLHLWLERYTLGNLWTMGKLEHS